VLSREKPSNLRFNIERWGLQLDAKSALSRFKPYATAGGTERFVEANFACELREEEVTRLAMVRLDEIVK